MRRVGIVRQICFKFKFIQSACEYFLLFYNQETIANRGLTSNYVLSILVHVCDAGWVSIKSPEKRFLCYEYSHALSRYEARPVQPAKNKRHAGGRFNSLPLEAIICQ